MIEAFPAGHGVWLRCQFHSHTTNSDGNATPAELCAHYAGLGFDVLAITDHWHVTEHVHPEILTLPGSELSCRDPGPSGEAEALALGVRVLPDTREPFEHIEAMATWITAQGGVPVLNHPYWSGLDRAAALGAPSVVALEVWNGGSEVMQGNGLSTVHWDDVLSTGRMLWGIATDDCHRPGEDSGIGWTWVHAAERSPDAVLDALRRGAAYGSVGPRLEAVEVGDETVEVRSSPAASIRLRSGPWDGCAVNADPAHGGYRGREIARDANGLITAARFDYPEYWRWARVEIEDERGRRAWGNPFRLPGVEPASQPGAFDS
ncbi:MAG: CehA/McbA family metallohydrolase [Gaiellales bacterium]